METKAQKVEQQIVLTDRETEHRNRSNSLHVLIKNSDTHLAKKSYAIVKRGSQSPKMTVINDEKTGTSYVVGCGTPTTIVRCPDYYPTSCHDKDLILTSCGSVRCSVCSHTALTRQVAQAVLPHQAYDAVSTINGSYHYDSHVVISPPKRMFTKDCIAAEGTKPVWAFMKDFFSSYNAGDLAASCVLHLTRKKHSDGSGCHDRNCELEHRDEWGPHVHGCGKIYLAPNDVIRKDYDGKLIVTKLPATLGERNIISTLKYELDHAHPVVNLDSDRSSQFVHKYGEISRQRMTRKLIRTEEYNVRCSAPQCQKLILDYDIDHSHPDEQYREGNPKGFHTKRNDVWEYRFKKFPGYAAEIHTEHFLEDRAYATELHPQVIQ